MAGLRYRRALDLMEAEIGNELVALDPHLGSCFGFNSVATRVWGALAQPQDVEALEKILSEEYDVDPEVCSRELAVLLKDMDAKGLITQER